LINRNINLNEETFQLYETFVKLITATWFDISLIRFKSAY